MPASAEGLSYQISGSAGGFNNRYGGYGLPGRKGIGNSYNRDFVDLKFSVATELMNGDTFVAAYNTSRFDVFSSFNVPDENTYNNVGGNGREGDATRYSADVTFRYLGDRNGYTFGGFVGIGLHNDYGDLDAQMGYTFAGAEVSRETQFGGFYAQAGMVDAKNNNWLEGIQNAPFINVGGRYELGNDFTLTGSLGYAGGRQGVYHYFAKPEERTILLHSNLFNARIGLERDFGNITGSVGYEITHFNSIAPHYVSNYNKTDRPYGETFDQFYVGFKYAFGANANHGSPLPSFGNWVALTENEGELPN
jgi:hypothetical protein